MVIAAPDFLAICVCVLSDARNYISISSNFFESLTQLLDPRILCSCFCIRGLLVVYMAQFHAGDFFFSFNCNYFARF